MLTRSRAKHDDLKAFSEGGPCETHRSLEALASKGWPGSPRKRFKALHPGKVHEMFTPTPPAEPQVSLRVLRCEAAKQLDVILCCRLYTGVMTHWIEDSTTLHAVKGPCEGCDAKQTPRWQGYIIVQSQESGLHRLLQFTPPVARTLDILVTGDAGLAGAMIRLRREGTNRNSPLYCDPKGFTSDHQTFPFEALQEAVSKLFRQDFPLFEAAKRGIGRLPLE